MAENARKNLKEIDALQALSLDDLPEGGLDNLWSRLKTIMDDRPDPSQVMGNGSDRRADAKAVLQKAEQDAAQATNAAFDKMRVEADEELAGARKVKAATIQAREKAEAAETQANEYKTSARQKADELLTQANERVDAMLIEAQEKIQQITSDADEKSKERIAEAETQAQEIIAEAKAKSDEVVAQVQSIVDRDVEGLKVEAIKEIKMVRDSIAQMQVELEEELETQRILTDAARLSMVSEAVTVGAETFVEKAANHGAPAQSAPAQAATAQPAPAQTVPPQAAATNGHKNGATNNSGDVQPVQPTQNTPPVEAKTPEVVSRPQTGKPTNP